MNISLLFVGFCIVCANSLDINEIVIIISSQSNRHHEALAEDLKSDIIQQSHILNKDAPIVHLTHIDFPDVVGAWTILPLIPYLRKLHHGNCSWFFFMEDKTRIRLGELLELLNGYDYTQEMWLGHAIRDREATIIHHFQFFEDPQRFAYPNAASGFAISAGLMKRLEVQWGRRKTSSADFSIDYAYELALFIWNDKKGTELTHAPRLCRSAKGNCATYSTSFQHCETSVPKTSIYFAVKTCGKFHGDRVTVVKGTWGKYAEIIRYFSDVEDEAIPTISLGIPNTEQGHCGKTIAILQYVANEIENRPEIKWIIIADDDTILSVARIQKFLSCYNDSEQIVLGERYGFNVYNEDGYNYITGGGGIIFSRGSMQNVVNSNMCKCPSISSPDDMFLGVCFRRLKIEVIHSSLFHQARPVDYAPEYLKDENVVSFHKHWMIDPFAVYNQWFQQEDTQMHNEL
ncbi:beta-1,3-glucosyltransferase [Photinus pyralis]|uniref:Fringe-like glycosyltransferase domain-containing protein n=1 Tax=Photinus pyralis TaxID=7054 RepID=A0A1Y1MDP7_PHOPY|nr:beta-1,3-glucosyltransferase [Photinus pyralis]